MPLRRSEFREAWWRPDYQEDCQPMPSLDMAFTDFGVLLDVAPFPGESR